MLLIKKMHLLLPIMYQNQKEILLIKNELTMASVLTRLDQWKNYSSIQRIFQHTIF